MLDACPHHHEEENAAQPAEGPLQDGLVERTGVEDSRSTANPGRHGPALGGCETTSKPRFWRSIDEWSGTPEFEQMLHREFPHAASEWKDEPSRRAFLKVMGASAALVGLTGCFQKPREKIVPYVDPPEAVIPGIPLFFATALSLNGYGRGVLIRSNEGRPTKVEGNPDHPASLGAADSFMQAAVLTMYDPDRSQNVVHAGDVGSWDSFLLALNPELDSIANNAGDGLRILSGSFTSPTLARQKAAFGAKYPNAKWHQYDPVGQENVSAGAKIAFGKDVSSVYSFDKAKIVLSLDSDFLLAHPGAVRYARDFVNGRRVRVKAGATGMNRLYVLEGTPSITGAMADHRVRLRPSLLEGVVRDLLAHVTQVSTTTQPSSDITCFDILVRDLLANKGQSLIIVGESQPPVVHALAHALNDALGNVGKTVIYTDPISVTPTDDTSLTALVADMQAGKVDTLVILGSNPVYDAPADLQFAEGLKKVRLPIHSGLFEDETAFLCRWHLPATHEFEQWSDLRAFDGSASIVQPLIAPLYAGKSFHQVVNFLMGLRDQSDYELVRETWRTDAAFAANFETTWRIALSKGVIDGSAAPATTVSLNAQAIASAPTTTPAAGSAGTIEVIFRPDPSIWDGTYSNNGWLQELPKPLTKLTWDNAVLLSPTTAARLEVEDNKVVELAIGDRTVKGSVLILPDHPDEAATLHLGYGRTRAGRVGTGTAEKPVGFSAYTLRTTDSQWQGPGLEVRPQDEENELAVTQHHQNMEGRDLIKLYPIDGYLAEMGKVTDEPKKIPLSLYESPTNYDDPDHKGNHKWGMSIDNNACTGCNACVVACVAENNIAVVGREQVIKGREMHWLRIDAYYTGTTEAAEGPYFEPVPCMQCENAPCELVCPVEATSHSAEGLNEMTYNRCVGTRYCSNNCPYKVRHFNFFLYQDLETESLMLARNPYVTVRTRGVMEKCTYCVQRLNAGRITSKKLIAQAATPGEDQDGLYKAATKAITDIQTACQQSCPTNAIVFGDLNIKDKDQNPVVALKDEPGNYSLLEDLNTRPRTTYLPRLVNPGT
jgi:molybdopterin-containing oxidoreductase family iron-sulfur binding subunit